MTKNSRARVVEIRDAVYIALDSAPFPLRSCQDLTAELARSGFSVKFTEVSGALMTLNKEGVVRKKKVYGGIITPNSRYWSWPHPRAFGFYGGNYPPPSRAYWFATDRVYEVFPMNKTTADALERATNETIDAR